MEVLPTIFAVVLVIITIVLSVVGIQLIFVLNEVRRTIHRVNQTIDLIETKANAVIQPLQSLGGMASGLKNGMRVFEAFVGWLSKDKK